MPFFISTIFMMLNIPPQIAVRTMMLTGTLPIGFPCKWLWPVLAKRSVIYILFAPGATNILTNPIG